MSHLLARIEHADIHVPAWLRATSPENQLPVAAAIVVEVAQMADPHLASPDWEPLFFDYLYVSLTNGFAFSPTDTMPLSRWAKALMSFQSIIALSTTALVVARAVNVLQ